ncbi:MAG: radical SAM protein [Myxococcales bacterium]|nr:radical SAM protein [Myxococcales bacterium]
MFDFANVLFAGPCNRACPFCIGNQLPASVNEPNLTVFPPRGLDAFVRAVNQHVVPEIVFTGTTSDPQLYRFEAELLALLRERLHPGARFSVHTNGVRVLSRLQVFNRYDRACISLPTLRPDIYEKMMGSREVPDLREIIRCARIPLKVSAVVNEHNADDIDTFIRECAGLGVRRFVVRRLFGDKRAWDILGGLRPLRHYRENPVFDYQGMEVTYWDFGDATSRSLNLFADGTLGDEYRLTETVQLRTQARPVASSRASVSLVSGEEIG